MKQGFTLIELLISVIILAVITASFSVLFNTSLKSLKTSEEFLAALNAAQSQMERLRSSGFSEISSRAFDDGRGAISVMPISHDLVEIKLVYKWRPGRQPIEFYSLRSKY